MSAAPTFANSVDDLERAKGLRRMRGIALGLLLFAALVFVLTNLFTDLEGVWGFVGRASEAAMIGAIADWFAVTALFRHPLGLPIPHTAIIPRRKDALGASLTSFVADNFLQGEVVTDKIRRAEVMKRAGDWLGAEQNREAVVARASEGIGYLLERIDDAEVASLARDFVIPKINETPKAPILGQLLGEVVRDGSHRGLVDLIAEEAWDWLGRNPDVVDRIVFSRAPSWVPDWVNDQVASRLRREILGWVSEVRDDREHPFRKSIDDWLRTLASDLQDDPQVSAKAEELMASILNRPGIVESVVALWGSLRRTLGESLADSDSEVRRRLRSFVNDMGSRMRDDAEFRTRWEERIARTAGDLADSFGPELASVISDTIERWDGVEAANRIELFVGKDLQYIRINGTVVGALVGIVIHALTLVL